MKFLDAMPNYYTGKKKKTYIDNHNTYIDYFNRLQEYVINMFEWENLPDSVDPRFIELSLCDRGFLVYFNDDVIGNLALNCTIGSKLDVYNYPIYRRAYAPNGYQKRLDNKNSVLIYNNYLHTPSILTIELYARRLAEIERTIDVNVKSQKTPLIIKCDKKQELTMRNLYQQYDGNIPVIFADENTNIDNISVIPTKSDYVADRLNTLKRQIWQEALTFCGIDNANTEKKERLVTDEIISNLGGVHAQRYVMLNARQDAAKKINKMFGTNIEVRFRQDTQPYYEEVELNGKVYDRTKDISGTEV